MPVTRFFHPVLPSRSLKKVPVRVQIAGQKFALWRDGSGRAAAVAEACPHRKAPLSQGRVRPDGRLACSYHGWHFDAEGRGCSPSQPELTRCDTVQAQNYDDRTEVLYRGPQRSSVWLPLLGARAGDLFQNEWVTRFDPVRAVFTFHWFDPKTGVERPLVTRTAVFMVPQTETTTWFHIFLFSRIGSSFYRLLKPLVHATTTLIGKRDVRNDADWAVHVADTPLELDGMRLGKFDKPVIRNRRLLHTIYWGRPFPGTSASPGIPSKTGEL